MCVRYASVTLQPPRHHRGRTTLAPLQLQVILAEEEDAPAGSKPVCWLLLTSLLVDSLEDALCYVRWYSYRWLIERYHFTLKSGCRLEDLQLEHAARIQRALATYLVVAWRLLWLTYQARRQPDQPCSDVLETHEWQALHCTIHQTPVPPSVPPTLRQAVHWIARLGGFLDRRSDGEPGVKTIWLGLRRLSDIAATWQLISLSLQPLSRLLSSMGNAKPTSGEGARTTSYSPVTVNRPPSLRPNTSGKYIS